MEATHKSHVADKQNVHQVHSTTWKSLLNFGDQRRLNKYEEDFATMQLEKFADELVSGGQVASSACTIDQIVGAGEPLICMPEQVSGEKMGDLTPHVPCLLRNSIVWSQLKKRPLLPVEHLVVQGLPVFGQEYGCKHTVPWDVWRSGLEPRDLKHLAGNSVHSMVAGTLTFWILANYIPRQKFGVVDMPQGIRGMARLGTFEIEKGAAQAESDTDTDAEPPCFKRQRLEASSSGDHC